MKNLPLILGAFFCGLSGVFAEIKDVPQLADKYTLLNILDWGSFIAGLIFIYGSKAGISIGIGKRLLIILGTFVIGMMTTTILIKQEVISF